MQQTCKILLKNYHLLGKNVINLRG